MFGFTEGQDLRVSAGYRAQFNQRGITKKVCGVAPAFKLGEVCGWRLLQGCKRSVGVGWAQFNQRGVTKKGAVQPAGVTKQFNLKGHQQEGPTSP